MLYIHAAWHATQACNRLVLVQYNVNMYMCLSSCALQLLTSPRGQHDQQLLVPLMVLMAQHLDWTLYTLHTEHVKEVAELYDKISYTTQQVWNSVI